MVPGVCGVYHDDGVYISTAKALTQANGYRLINLPDSPPQTKYPILYPALLAIVWKFCPTFPDNIAAMQWLTLIFSGLAAGLSYLYLVACGYASRPVALLAAALAATSPCYLYYGILPLSEMPFAVFTILAMFALERHLANPLPGRIGQTSLGILLALPYLIRTIGIVFIPAGLFLTFWSRRPVFWVGLGAAMVGAPWAFWSVLAPRWGESVVVAYYTNYFSWWQTMTENGGWGKIFLTNFILTSCMPVIMSFARLSRPDLNWLVLLGCAILGLFGLAQIVRGLRPLRVLPLFLLSYLTLTLIWPWPPSRFLIPFLPFLVAFFLSSIWNLLSPRSILRRSWLVPVLLGVFLVAANLAETYLVSQNNDKNQYPFICFLGDEAEMVRWSSYQEVFAWLKDHTRQDEVIAGGFDSMIYLYTGRQAFRPFVMRPEALFYGGQTASGGIPELANFFKIYRPSYLIQTPMPGFSEEKPFEALLREVQEQYPGWLTPIFQGKDVRFRIYRIRPDMSPAS